MSASGLRTIAGTLFIALFAMACAVYWSYRGHREAMFLVHAFLFGMSVQSIIYWLSACETLRRARKVGSKAIGIGLMLAVSIASCPGAEKPITQATAPAPPADGYVYQTSLPFLDQPIGLPAPSSQDPQLAQSPFLIGILCLAVAVGVAGWVGVKAFDKCQDIKVHLLTNAPPDQARGPALIASSEVPVPDVSTLPPVTGDCSCGAVSSANSGALILDAPLPIAIEHSSDRRTWSTVARGVTMGEAYSMPATGFWRARALPLSLEFTSAGVVLHAPPGILEASHDLVTWSPLAVNRSDSDLDLAAEPGTFYRVRL